MTGGYDSQQEAIVAALDELTEPGDKLIVHNENCTAYKGECTCQPLVWTYPE